MISADPSQNAGSNLLQPATLLPPDQDDSCSSKKTEPCANGSNTIAVPALNPLPANPAPPPTEWSGTSGPKKPGTYAATTKKEWTLLWAKISQEKPPAVDFSKQMAVVIFAGEQKDRNIVIVASQAEKNTFVVKWKLVPSGSTRPKRPYVIRLLPKTKFPVRFKEQS